MQVIGSRDEWLKHAADIIHTLDSLSVDEFYRERLYHPVEEEIIRLLHSLKIANREELDAFVEDHSGPGG